MTLAQIYNVASQAGLQHLPLHIAEDYNDLSLVSKVEVGFYDSEEDAVYAQDEAAEFIAENAEYAGLNYVQYESKYVTKVLLLS